MAQAIVVAPHTFNYKTVPPAVTPVTMIYLFYLFLGVLLQLPDLAVRFYLMGLGVDVASLAAFQATLVIPWCLKPLYGFVSDSFPVCGLRRKPYVIVCNVLNCGLWMAMALMEDTPVWAAQILLFLASVMTCFTDVMYDSILVLSLIHI